MLHLCPFSPLSLTFLLTLARQVPQATLYNIHCRPAILIVFKQDEFFHGLSMIYVCECVSLNMLFAYLFYNFLYCCVVLTSSTLHSIQVLVAQSIHKPLSDRGSEQDYEGRYVVFTFNCFNLSTSQFNLSTNVYPPLPGLPTSPGGFGILPTDSVMDNSDSVDRSDGAGEYP